MPAGFISFPWLEVASAACIGAAYLAIAVAVFRCGRRHREPAHQKPLFGVLIFMTTSAALWLATAWGAARHPYLTRWLIVLNALVGVATVFLLWRGITTLLTPAQRAEPSDVNALLEKVQQESERFIASISHDLRGPLTTIASQAGMLEQSLGSSLTPEQRQRLARMHTGVRHMADIIDGLLRLSRIARQQLRCERIDLSKLAEDILVARLRHEPTRRVDVSIEPDLVLYADPELMTSAFTHLIENAWKFTVNTPHARIEVGHTEDDGSRAIFVRDNGAGFDMRYAKKLFQPFQRLHGSEFAGTGVGLAIVARAVERHEGRIWARSQPNEGATFYLSLPRIHLPEIELPKADLPKTTTPGAGVRGDHQLRDQLTAFTATHVSDLPERR